MQTCFIKNLTGEISSMDILREQAARIIISLHVDTMNAISTVHSTNICERSMAKVTAPTKAARRDECSPWRAAKPARED